MDFDAGEFTCPLCRRMANALMPLLTPAPPLVDLAKVNATDERPPEEWQAEVAGKITQLLPLESSHLVSSKSSFRKSEVGLSRGEMLFGELHFKHSQSGDFFFPVVSFLERTQIIFSFLSS